MDSLARVCERIAARAGRLRKVAILAEYLRGLEEDDLETAVRFLACGPVAGIRETVDLFGEQEARTLSVGHAALREAAIRATGLPVDLFRLCAREAGDTGEAIGLLVNGEETLPLAEAQEIYLRLHRGASNAEKLRLLADCFKRRRGLTVKYFVKIITGGLRIGLQSKMVEEAIAEATGAPLDEVRAANNRIGNLAAVARAARRGELSAIEARLFHPMEFMLARPIEAAEAIADPDNWIVEDKYDGIRAQAHVDHGRAALYTRGLDEVTGAFPELEAALSQVNAAAAIDGEILAWRDGRALPFTVLQHRLARKRATRQLSESTPVVFMAYDILFADGSMILEEPIETRRRTLEDMLAGHGAPLMLSPRFHAGSAKEIHEMFEASRLRGNEGLLLKRRGSVYEAGKRGGAWLKLKRPFATLDVVITAAEQGHGKRATMLSDYTFGVRSDGGFVNVGKAYSGLTDAEIRELTRRLRGAQTEKFGRVVLVRPEIVLEVAFDGIQKSTRHKSGFALRFPRIVRWRRDKRAEEADDLARVAELYSSAVNLTASREKP